MTTHYTPEQLAALDPDTLLDGADTVVDQSRRISWWRVRETATDLLVPRDATERFNLSARGSDGEVRYGPYATEDEATRIAPASWQDDPDYRTYVTYDASGDGVVHHVFPTPNEHGDTWTWENLP